MSRKFNEREFLSFLDGLPEALKAVEAKGLEEGAEELLKEARNEIGHYQRDDMGPLPPWAELADSTKADRLYQGFSENDPGLRTGEMRDSYTTQINGQQIILGSSDPVAEVFENGRLDADHFQPPRPVIAVALYRKEEPITEQIARRIAQALAGRRITNG